MHHLRHMRSIGERSGSWILRSVVYKSSLILRFEGEMFLGEFFIKQVLAGYLKTIGRD